MTPFDLIGGELTASQWATLEYGLRRDIGRRQSAGIPVPAQFVEFHGVLRRALALHQLSTAVAEHGHNSCQFAGVDEILDVESVACALGQSVRTVRRWAQSGRLPGSHKLAGGAWVIPGRALINERKP